MVVQTLLILWKSHKEYAFAGRLYSPFWSNLSKTFSFGGPIALPSHWGEILQEVPSFVPNFTPIGATCRPCGAKNLKIGLWVTYIPARCSARNAVGNKQKTRRFWPPRRRMKSKPHQIWHGDREPRVYVLAPRKLSGLRRIVLPLEGVKIWGKPDTPVLKPP